MGQTPEQEKHPEKSMKILSGWDGPRAKGWAAAPWWPGQDRAQQGSHGAGVALGTGMDIPSPGNSSVIRTWRTAAASACCWWVSKRSSLSQTPVILIGDCLDSVLDE